MYIRRDANTGQYAHTTSYTTQTHTDTHRHTDTHTHTHTHARARARAFNSRTVMTVTGELPISARYIRDTTRTQLTTTYTAPITTSNTNTQLTDDSNVGQDEVELA